MQSPFARGKKGRRPPAVGTFRFNTRKQGSQGCAESAPKGLVLDCPLECVICKIGLAHSIDLFVKKCVQKFGGFTPPINSISPNSVSILFEGQPRGFKK